jgi:hypothetical protein
MRARFICLLLYPPPNVSGVFLGLLDPWRWNGEGCLETPVNYSNTLLKNPEVRKPHLDPRQKPEVSQIKRALTRFAIYTIYSAYFVSSSTSSL